MDPQSKRFTSSSGLDRLRPVPAQPLPQQTSSYPTGLSDSPFGAISRTFNKSPTLVGSLQDPVGPRTSPASYPALGQGYLPPTVSFLPDLQQRSAQAASSYLEDRHSVIGLVGGDEEEVSEGYYDSWTLDSAVAGDEETESETVRPGQPRRAASLDTLSGASTSPSAGGSSRSSRVAAEQRRRNDLQDSFRRLNEILPASNDRPSKKVILERAITTIIELRQNNETLAKKLASYEAPSQAGTFPPSKPKESSSVVPVQSALSRPPHSRALPDLKVVPSVGPTSSYPTPSDSSFPRFSFHPAPLSREHGSGTDG